MGERVAHVLTILAVSLPVGVYGGMAFIGRLINRAEHGPVDLRVRTYTWAAAALWIGWLTYVVAV